ncbi:pentatricopeptide repeat-containing protein At2g13600-like [Selaginella moellendorffii]|uniref:pentatricopeptide repeat-containing protein At2g13600-like n=1 Tax=Selaginella moellendorffii TaxID=88036 RepID=UPI000D1C7E25|nr:pentatricopeptide repeat-containing protein At2g13600-like [Selaginella moellendorffii]|eukprot:XP_024542753.1 pentatricopeptide repeat-containing protein At2g13600-like [Selaginella moellendorffii]
MYAKCGSLADARSIFAALEDRRVVSWTVLMLGYCEHGEADAALDLFREMQAQGCKPNSRTFLAVLKACTKLAEKEAVKAVCLERVMTVHSRALDGFGELDIQLANALVDSYARCGSIWDSQRVFDGMKTRSVVSWTSLMLGYVENGQENLALELLSLTQEKMDAQMLVAAVKACTTLATKELHTKIDGKPIKVAALERAMAVHSQAANLGHDSSTFLASALVDLYAKCGSLADAKRLFDRIPRPGVVLWTALILGYAETQEEEQALDLFSSMTRRGCRPNCQTYVAALKACAAAGLIKVGREIHAEVCRHGLEDEAVTANSLVDFYAKCGRMATSQQLFDLLRERGLISWNTLITGYTHQGNTGLVFDSWGRMQDEGVQPDVVTFVGVLSACSHAGLVHRGRQLFAAMASKFGVAPGIEHYGCMADLFGRADELNEAIAMAETGPSTVAWLAVLAACCKLKNVEVGKAAFKSLLEATDSAATYDLMANIYAQTPSRQ